MKMMIWPILQSRLADVQTLVDNMELQQLVSLVVVLELAKTCMQTIKCLWEDVLMAIQCWAKYVCVFLQKGVIPVILKVIEMFKANKKSDDTLKDLDS